MNTRRTLSVKPVKNLLAIVMFVAGILILILILPTGKLLARWGLGGTLSPQTVTLLPYALAFAVIIVGVALLASSIWLGFLARVFQRLEALPTRSFLMLLIALALAVRLIWLFAVPSVPYTDYAVYDGLAHNLAEGRGFVDDFSPPSMQDYGKLAWRPPGLPYLLAAGYRVFGDNLNVGKAVILFFSFALVIATYFLGVSVFGASVGRIAALLMAFFPSVIAYTSVLDTELAFAFFLVLALYLLCKRDLRWYSLILAGAMLGICALIRPIILPLVVILPLYYYLLSRNILRSLGKAVIVGVAMLLVIFPWTLRNLSVLGSPVLVSTNSGTVLWEGTQTTSAGDAGLMTYPSCDQLTEVQCDAKLRTLAIQNILADPVGYAKYSTIKLIRLYVFDYEGVVQATQSTVAHWSLPDTLRFGLMVGSELYYLAVVALMIAASVWAVLRRLWKPEYTFFWVFFLVWSAIYFVFHGESRYHMPLLPLFACFAALGLVQFFAAYRPRPEPQKLSTV